MVCEVKNAQYHIELRNNSQSRTGHEPPPTSHSTVRSEQASGMHVLNFEQTNAENAIWHQEDKALGREGHRRHARYAGAEFLLKYRWITDIFFSFP